MTPVSLSQTASLALLGVLAACAPADSGAATKDPDFQPDYLSVSTRLLDRELVNFVVQMRGARNEADVLAYIECAAAQYTLIRGLGFARRVTVKAVNEDGLWTGNGVYTLSDALPGGRFTIDAEVAAQNCAEQNIPMV
jgi:hypothetical protein